MQVIGGGNGDGRGDGGSEGVFKYEAVVVGLEGGDGDGASSRFKVQGCMADSDSARRSVLE